MSKEAHSEQENFMSVSLSEDQKTVTITVEEGVEVKYQKAEKENENIYEVAKDGEAIVITHLEGVTVNVQYFETEEVPAPAPKPWDKPITFGLVGVLALAVLIAVIRRATKKEPAPVVVAAAPAPVVEAPKAPGSAGQLKLHSVEPKTAAMVMAIVADKLQKPINELRFISIKEVE